MNTKILLASLALLLVAGQAEAKQWNWRALTLNGSTATEVAKGSECNYAKAIKAAREAAPSAVDETSETVIALSSREDLVACPAKVRSAAKAVAAPTTSE